MKTSNRLAPARQLGELIRQARTVSQEGLAELIGTKQPVISRYERGAAIPSSRHLSALIHVLHLDADKVYDLVRRHYAEQPNGGEAA